MESVGGDHPADGGRCDGRLPHCGSGPLLSEITTPEEAAMITARAYGGSAAQEIAQRAGMALNEGRYEDCLFWHEVLAKLGGNPIGSA